MFFFFGLVFFNLFVFCHFWQYYFVSAVCLSHGLGKSERCGKGGSETTKRGGQRERVGSSIKYFISIGRVLKRARENKTSETLQFNQLKKLNTKFTLYIGIHTYACTYAYTVWPKITVISPLQMILVLFVRTCVFVGICWVENLATPPLNWVFSVCCVNREKLLFRLVAKFFAFTCWNAKFQGFQFDFCMQSYFA